jgi:hypothetical protein
MAAPADSQGPRPAVAPGLPIDSYSGDDLGRLAAWVLELHPRATNAELLPLLMRELGFARRGTRIVARLEAAIQRARE